MSVPPERRLLTRRAAARAIAAAALATLAAPRAVLAHSARPRPSRRPAGVGADPLRLGVARTAAGDGASRAAANGIALGAEEARRGAALLGRTVEVREGAVDELLGGGVDALVAAGTPADRDALAAAAERASVVWLDLACGEVERPVASHVFHLAPGPATRRAAAARAGRSGDILLWHPSLERFGAGQLNARFVARFGEAMTSGAWAGWAAVKIAWESFLRLDAARGESLAAFLVSSRARFDGHKGRALHFDPATHELRQPLYIASERGTDGPTAVEEIAPAPSAGRGEAP
jgi:hypothetical protein